MDYKKNSLFFDHKRTKRWTRATYVAYAFIAIAVLIFLLIGGSMGLPTALPFAVIGVAILLTALSMMTSEKQIKEVIGTLQNSAKEDALAHFEHPEQNPDLFFEFEGYDLTDESLMLRQKKNGRNFTPIYAITYLMIDGKTLRVFQKRTSLIEPKEEVLTLKLALTEPVSAEYFSETRKRVAVDGEEKELPIIAILLKDGAGNPVCTVNCKTYGYDIERFVETVAHTVKRLAQK